MKLLITGAAGFIGHALAQRMLSQGYNVIGIDNLNDYYDVSLKQARLDCLSPHSAFSFINADIADRVAMSALFAAQKFDVVINLAAQAGVRYSLENPHAYIDANIQGFLNILEGCRHSKVGHLVFASSSSVYGANTTLPFNESHSVDHPVSLYAATKKANELMAHSYASLYGVACTGLRLFTVYGPWGRPDMALFKFTKSILAGEPVQVFNHGKMVRDFTYIDDVVEAIMRLAVKPATPNANWSGATPDPASSDAPYCIYNLGNSEPIELMRYIHAIETAVGKPALLQMLPMQSGDVLATSADIARLEQAIGFRPRTRVEDGVAKFVTWYRAYYKV
jgi:UDP-glucuronate 4-epimerase